MKLADSLKTLADAIERTHHKGFFESEVPRSERTIPNFVTASNGMQVNFEGESCRMANEFTKTLVESVPDAWSKVKFDALLLVFRETVADFYVAGTFDANEGDWPKSVRQVKADIKRRIDERMQVVTHHLPAWTCRFEQFGDFQLGPVIIRSRENWVRSVDFSDGAKEHEGGAAVNVNWRESLIEALGGPRAEAKPVGLGNLLYDALVKCPAVVSVTVSGYHASLSKRVGELICKTALDSLSLALGDETFFLQQALSTERLPPIGSDMIVETNGYLHLPGSSISKRLPLVEGKRIAARLKECEALLASCGEILWAHLEPDARRHPGLSKRWATALAWFAEGARESTDAIALAKLGTCLDILSSGGTDYGICEMLVNLTGAARDDMVLQGRRPRTLSQLVADVYNHGRSEILHGNRYDRLEDLEDERRRAFDLARIALSVSAVRLHSYTGADEDKAFVTMSGSKPDGPEPSPNS
ncbi:MAG: hypothetical protein LCH89_17785 [Proteobacteria bacterium]|nr:hypothetical protein [Pseudomonadota bacterium]